MKVVAFSGSARKDGNTALLLKTVLAELGSLLLKQNLRILFFSNKLEAMTTIDNSFLSNEMNEAYKEVLEERYARIFQL